jgi:beta-lactamase regulating signal transducer with metallopeptidase domain
MTGLIITSSVLILMIIIMRHFLKGKISLRLQYALWALVLVRLLVPITLFESPISVMNAVETAASVRQEQASTPVVAAPSALGDPEAVPPGVTVEVNPDAVTNVHHRVFHWGLLAKWVWYAGIGVVGLCLLLSNLSFGRKLRRTRKRFQADNCKLPVYEVEALPSPCLFGLFRPVIYITPDVAGDETKLHHVLAHELTHWRHGDHIWSALRGFCLAIHWYNPLVWLAATLSRRDAELACDESAIKSIGEANRMEYGRTLIGLTCEKRKVMDLLSTATTMTDDKNGIRERVTLIAKKPKMLVPALIAVLLVMAVAVGCTFTGAKNEAEIVPLTADEVDQYNKAFEPLLFDKQGNPSVNPLSHFLTSHYDRPEDINLAELLRYFPPEGDVTDEAELEALKAEENWPFDADVTLGGMPVPIHRFPAGMVNGVLLKHMDVALDDLSGVGMDELIYLEEYDAYYNFTSDFAAGMFICKSGETQGDIVRLYGGAATLTLKKHGDSFLFVSHQRAGDASGEATGDSFDQAQDITLIGLNGEKCPLRLGMNADEATEKLEAANIDLKGDYTDQLFNEDYSLWFTEASDEAEREVWVLSSVSVKTPVIETAEGLKNGDAEDKIERIYGPCGFVERDETEGHRYYHYEMENYILEISSGSGGKFSDPDDPYYVFSWRISSKAQSNSYFPDAAERAQAVLDSVVSGGTVSITLTTADGVGGGRYEVPLEHGNGRNRVRGFDNSFDWSYMKSAPFFSPESVNSLKVESPDGAAALQCWQGSNLVLCTLDSDSFLFSAGSLGSDAVFDGTIFSYLRAWYDEAEIRGLRGDIIIPDNGQSNQEIAKAWADAYEGAMLRATPGSGYACTYVKTAASVKEDSMDSWFPAKALETEHFYFDYSTVFVRENGKTNWLMAGNTVDYTGSDAPAGALEYFRMGPMYLTEEGWRCDGVGTGP